MFKTSKSKTINLSLMFIFVLFAIVFLGNKAWQEYLIYQANNIDTAAGSSNQLLISWLDNAADEDGFIIERKTDGQFVPVATLGANITSYIENNTVAGTRYCYRIGAFNLAGTAYSDESCIDLPVISENEVPPVQPEGGGDDPQTSPQNGNVQISYEFIDKPIEIAVEGREFYGFKEGKTYNAGFSVDEIENVNLSVGDGTSSPRNASYFSFQDGGSELQNGYVGMKFNTLNQAQFSLRGNGSTQHATLYMSAGAWTSEEAGITITAGDQTQTIVLPTGYTWHYFAVDISFDQYATVTVTPTSSYGGYSYIKFAGIILNNPSEAIKPSFASLIGVDMSAEKVIDVSGLKYMASDYKFGNGNVIDADINKLEYTGTSAYSTSTYSFVDNGIEVAKGNTHMSWDESNGVLIDLKNSGDLSSIASLYFRAGAWTNDTASIDLSINGESNLIDLDRGYSWHYMRVDVEFEGKLHLELKPVGKIGGYSRIYFAGLTVQ
ncbi:fibronectin type III domain-containing protein [Psychromonas antarctica]|uniref:fibronectin type III domain-containing protein n=1 Tax=Psychromonas antarctica TaxID=67573 RepID=UPI001EE8BAED|nr:fibronectin type III domain-containing protein [Psychromonas antarctica]MCG6201297.1 fibronectin type III domain-containing protein [Psychromonas antarctica]